MSTANKFRFILSGFKHFYQTSIRKKSFNILRLCQRYYFLKYMKYVFEAPRSRLLLFSATAVCHSGCNIKDTISDKEMKLVLLEMEEITKLKELTLYCENCKLRRVIDQKHAGVQYCSCKSSSVINVEECDGWLPYMETTDVIIWRKEFKSGIYGYKVYGRYTDVRVGDFVAVQLDSDYRKYWDSAVAELKTVEQDSNINQDVIYWETIWPRLFANRDYVYVRRYQTYPGNRSFFSSERDNIHVIVSRACSHPSVPDNKNAVRVTEYWSHMVARRLSTNTSNNAGDVRTDGTEYVLTYYEEAWAGGIPTGVAAWVTGRAAPDYLERMRHAARTYADWLTATKSFSSEDEEYDENRSQPDEGDDGDTTGMPRPIPKKRIIPICSPIPHKESPPCKEDDSYVVIISDMKNATDEEEPCCLKPKKCPMS